MDFAPTNRLLMYGMWILYHDIEKNSSTLSVKSEKMFFIIVEYGFDYKIPLITVHRLNQGANLIVIIRIQV